jgi:hypothetical protein
MDLAFPPGLRWHFRVSIMVLILNSTKIREILMPNVILTRDKVVRTINSSLGPLREIRLAGVLADTLALVVSSHRRR